MPELETSVLGRRILADQSLSATKGYCARTFWQALGIGSGGNANQAHRTLERRGWAARQPGQIEPGDAVQWVQFGGNPKSAGFRYGHIGVAARNAETGQMGYVSNFEGVRKWRPLDNKWRAFAPPKSFAQGRRERFLWSGSADGGPNGLPDGGSITETLPVPAAPAIETPYFDAARDQLLQVQAPQYTAPPEPEPEPLMGQRAAAAAVDYFRQHETEAAPVRQDPLQPVWQDFHTGIHEDQDDLVDTLREAYQGAAKSIPHTVEIVRPALGAVRDFLSKRVLPQAANQVVGPLGVAAAPLGMALAERLSVPERVIGQQLDRLDAMLPPSPGEDAGERQVRYAVARQTGERPWLDETFAQTLMANLREDRQFTFADNIREQTDLKSDTYQGSIVPGLAPALGFLADAAVNPLTYANPGFGKASLSVSATNKAMAREALPVIEQTIGTKLSGVVRNEVEDLIFGMGQKGLRSDLSDGLEFVEEHAARVVEYLKDKGIASETAHEVARDLMKRWRAIVRAPFNLFGYPLPKAARARDALREFVGLTGIDSTRRISGSLEAAARRSSFKQFMRNLTGIEPMVPFESEADAYISSQIRRVMKARLVGEKRAALLVKPQAWRGEEVIARMARANSEVNAAEDAAVELAEITADDLANVWIKAQGIREGATSIWGTAPPIEAALKAIAPELSMPNYWRNHLKRVHATVRSIITHNTNQTKTIFSAFSPEMNQAAMLYAQTDTFATEAENITARAARLHDLLERTEELAHVVPYSLQDSDAAVSLLEEYVEKVARESPRGSTYTAYIGDAEKLRQAGATKAAEVVNNVEKNVRPLYEKWYDEAQVCLQYVRDHDLADDATLRPWDEYMPIRSDSHIVDWLQFATGNATTMANTPGIAQAFLKARKADNMMQVLRNLMGASADEIAERAAVKGLTPEQYLAAQITDLETLTLIRGHEQAELVQFVETHKMLQRSAIHMSDPRAAQLIELGWQPLSRFMGPNKHMHPVAQGIISSGMAGDYKQMAEAFARVPGYRERLNLLVENKAGAEEIARATAALKKAEAKAKRLAKSFANARFNPRSVDTYQEELIEYLVPPPVAAHYKPNALSRAATALSILNEKFMVNWFRGNVLISAGFHVRNFMDNFVGGAWLAGMGMVIGGDHINPVLHANNAIKVMLEDVIGWGDLSETVRLQRLENFQRWWPKQVFGNLSKERIAELAEAARLVNLDSGGIFRADIGGRPANRFVRAVDAPRRWNRRVGQTLEAIPRVSTFVAAMEKGYSPWEAKALADDAFVNYSNEFNAPIDDLLNQLMLFWPYTRRRMEQVAVSIFRHPNQLVMYEQAKDRWTGDSPKLQVTDPLGGGRYDIPLSILPDVEDMGLGFKSEFSDRDRYLLDHGFKGRKMAMFSSGWTPIALPDRNPDGTWDTDPMSAKFLDAIEGVLPNKAMRALKGDHFLLWRTGMGVEEMLGRMRNLTLGDLSDLPASMTPPLQIAREMAFPVNEESRTPSGEPMTGWGRAASSLAPTATGYVPGGSLLRAPLKAKIAQIKRGDKPLPRTRGAAYQRAAQKGRYLANIISFAAGATFAVVAKDDLLDNLSPRERREFVRAGKSD